MDENIIMHCNIFPRGLNSTVLGHDLTKFWAWFFGAMDIMMIQNTHAAWPRSISCTWKTKAHKIKLQVIFFISFEKPIPKVRVS